MTIPDKVRSFMRARGVDYELVRHPKSESTHETAGAAHVPDDHIAKAVVVKDASGYALAVIPGDRWLKLDALNSELDRSFELASEGEIEGLFPDCRLGAVPPLGEAYGLESYVDESVLALGKAYLEAGDHQSVLSVSGDGLRALLSGVRRGHFCGD